MEVRTEQTQMLHSLTAKVTTSLIMRYGIMLTDRERRRCYLTAVVESAHQLEIPRIDPRI